MIAQGLLIAVALAYSAAMVSAGRRLPCPASLAAYSTALAVLVAVPLFPEQTVQRVDRVLLVAGAGRLLVHVAFMTALSSLMLTVVLATHRWAWRHWLAVGGAGVLMGLFVVCWLAVQSLHLPDMAAVFYGHGAHPPTPVLWMNVVRGGGIVYIAAWSLGEFQHFLRSARRTYERGVAGVAIMLYVLTGGVGSLTMLESVARHRGMNMAVVQQGRITFTVIVLIVTAVGLAGQIWLWPLWRHRRQLLLRYVEPELVQLRNDLLNLSVAEAELHLDMHHETYANRAIVEAVAARCRAAGISAARCAMARMAASLLTFHRDNVLQDPGYGLVTSWEELMEDAATEIDQAMAMTAWEKALRDGYVSQHVYCILFLVLNRREYRELLLIDEHPQVQVWHQQLADMIATVMHAHGHATPRYVTLARRAAPENRLARLRARLASKRRDTVPGPSMLCRDDAGNRGERKPTT